MTFVLSTPDRIESILSLAQVGPVEALRSTLPSIRGCSPIVTAMIIGHTVDITRFASAAHPTTTDALFNALTNHSKIRLDTKRLRSRVVFLVSSAGSRALMSGATLGVTVAGQDSPHRESANANTSDNGDNSPGTYYRRASASLAIATAWSICIRGSWLAWSNSES
jgi:hypothetical protein